MSYSNSVAAKVRVECITPILRVSKLAASIRFYVDVLGFKVNWAGRTNRPSHRFPATAEQSCWLKVSKDIQAHGSGSELRTLSLSLLSSPPKA
jgi:catechol 2,3-dioxygenase-like lactoylglutathione lyase family enzyme